MMKVEDAVAALPTEYLERYNAAYEDGTLSHSDPLRCAVGAMTGGREGYWRYSTGRNPYGWQLRAIECVFEGWFQPGWQTDQFRSSRIYDACVLELAKRRGMQAPVSRTRRAVQLVGLALMALLV